MHTDAPAGAMVDQGTMQVSVPLGTHIMVPINVKVPTTGTRGYLILTSSKGSVQTFREDAEFFTLL